MKEVEIQYRKTSSLVPYEKNPRFNKNAISFVSNSIKEFGFKVPIVIDKDGVIIAGHTRLEAAKSLGLEEVPVIIADDLTEKQVKAFRLADNKVAEIATWDFDLLDEELADLDGAFDMKDFGFGGIVDPSAFGDDVPEIKEDNYDAPKEAELECPFCHKRDIVKNFKKVDV